MVRHYNIGSATARVMAGLVPAIHGLQCAKNVDARDKPGHDDTNGADLT